MKRTLTLSRETVAELTADELGAVVGGAITVQGFTCPLIGGCINFSTPPRCE